MVPGEFSRNPEQFQPMDRGPQQVNVILGSMPPEKLAEAREVARQVLLAGPARALGGSGEPDGVPPASEEVSPG